MHRATEVVLQRDGDNGGHGVPLPAAGGLVRRVSVLLVFLPLPNTTVAFFRAPS